MLPPAEIEKQLTQRRLDSEGYELRIKQLQSQLNDLKQQNTELNSTLTTLQSTIDSLLPGAFNASQQIFRYTAVFKQTVSFMARATFNALASFASGLITSLIYPSADSTTAVKVTKADGSTTVFVVNTTDSSAGLGSAVPVTVTSGRRYMVVKGVSDMGVLHLTQTATDADGLGVGLIEFGDANSTSGSDKRIVTIRAETKGTTATDRGGRLIIYTKADGGAAAEIMRFDPAAIGFWGSIAAAKQTLNAYTTDPESSAYTGIDNAQAGTVYAQVADLNSLRVAYENIRASYDDLRTKLQTTTLVG